MLEHDIPQGGIDVRIRYVETSLSDRPSQDAHGPDEEDDKREDLLGNKKIEIAGYRQLRLEMILMLDLTEE